LEGFRSSFCPVPRGFPRGAALIFSTVLATSTGRFIAVAVNIAYPLGDFGLLVFVLLAFALSGRRLTVIAAAGAPAVLVFSALHPVTPLAVGLAAGALFAGARIVAMCDAFEAITTDRCYQRARPEPDAIAELRRNAGTQFDAAVIEALCRHLASRPRRDRSALREPQPSQAANLTA
jgi:hypothetical protein